MKLLSLYEKMPVLIQNIGVSLYGIIRENSRYGGDFKKNFALVQEYEFADTETLQKIQRDKLKELFAVASTSAHYNSLFKRCGVDVENGDPFEILDKLPILEKSELRGHEDRFYTVRAKGALHFHTSGSTGTPLNILMSKSDLRMRMAVLERQKERFGVNHRSRQISFVGKKITSNNSKIFWRHNIFGNQLVMSVYDISPKNKTSYIHKIRDYNPKVVEGYPSALAVIAKWLIDDNIQLTTKCVFVTAESLSNDQRTVIEKGFGCPVVDYYGSTEGATMITQCEKGCLHIDRETGIIEFLNDEGKVAAPGEIAHMVITSFTTQAMPLIRYNIGDLAVVQETLCDCGRSSPVITEICGRVDDVFETPEKGYVGRLSTSLKLLPSRVRRAQIHQFAPTEFTLLVECDDELNEKERAIILNDIRDKLGNVDIQVKCMSKIPNGNNGKFRMQINHCQH